MPDEKPLDTPYPPYPVVAGDPPVPGLPNDPGPATPPTTGPTTPPKPVEDPKDLPLKATFKGELTFLDLPPHRRATDRTAALTGFARSTTTSKRETAEESWDCA